MTAAARAVFAAQIARLTLDDLAQLHHHFFSRWHADCNSLRERADARRRAAIIESVARATPRGTK